VEAEAYIFYILHEKVINTKLDTIIASHLSIIEKKNLRKSITKRKGLF
jgi:hypothetical protein